MLIAISYHPDDYQLMLRWAKHVAKLGNYPNHQILLAPAHGALSDEISAILRPSFGEVLVEACYHPEKGWPLSCNLAFEHVAWYVYNNKKRPFMWMEPDAVPVSADWIDRIESEYEACGMPFMGDFVKIEGVMPNGIDHMSGIAVYHWDLPRLAPSIFRNERLAWDIASASHVVRAMKQTNLIHHDWIPEKKWRRDVVDASCVKAGAVVYHPDKKGILFNDGLSPNGVQGDPATGGSCESIPHETKVKQPEKEKEIDRNIKEAIELVDAIHDKTRKSVLVRRAVLRRLYEKKLGPRPIKKFKRAKYARTEVQQSVETD